MSCDPNAFQTDEQLEKYVHGDEDTVSNDGLQQGTPPLGKLG